MLTFFVSECLLSACSSQAVRVKVLLQAPIKPGKVCKNVVLWFCGDLDRAHAEQKCDL